MTARRPGASRVELEADRRERDLRRAFGLDVRNQLEDAGISQAALARAARMSPAQISRLLAGLESPSLNAVAALSVALNGRPVMRIEPNTGPRLRDRFQSRILEALLRDLHARWKRFSEVPVYRPVRGFIDLVLHDPDPNLAIATEIHSQVRRLEQQLRWGNAKADALVGGSELPLTDPETGARPTVSRLLVLSATATNVALVREFSETFHAAFPADPIAAVASLTTNAPWPGPAVIWARIDGSTATILRTLPRGLR